MTVARVAVIAFAKDFVTTAMLATAVMAVILIVVTAVIVGTVVKRQQTHTAINYSTER